ncbi:MAG: hypothetical protein GKR95_02095 [Gammaproteobacteria bacterium]|nr:hypothetical protein [Gammaproteobacteria bacterium]
MSAIESQIEVNGRNVIVNVNTAHPTLEPEAGDCQQFLEYLIEANCSIATFDAEKESRRFVIYTRNPEHEKTVARWIRNSPAGFSGILSEASDTSKTCLERGINIPSCFNARDLQYLYDGRVPDCAGSNTNLRNPFVRIVPHVAESNDPYAIGDEITLEELNQPMD